MKPSHCINALALTAVLLGLPLIGATLAGKPASTYLEFPPLTHHVIHASFSWSAFIGLALFILAMVLPFEIHVLRSRFRQMARQGRLALPWVRHSGSGLEVGRSVPAEPFAERYFPWWGHFGILLSFTTWYFAWSRHPWFAPFQYFTFSPLWLGYILTVNAWTLRRSGRCMLLHRTRFFLTLFPVSAAFWWFFEYLNRFVENWYYIGIADLTPLRYAVFATLPFATVLPAVLGTHDLLATFPNVGVGLDHFRPLRVTHPRHCAIAWLTVAVIGLTGIGLFPDYLFPLLWIAPLILITATQCLRGAPTLFTPLAQGDWQRIYRHAIAALICGFFWEMWNYHSAAKWIYAVPYVQRFHLFEMPLLGFAGYLPFGLECAVIGDVVAQALTPKERAST